MTTTLGGWKKSGSQKIKPDRALIYLFCWNGFTPAQITEMGFSKGSSYRISKEVHEAQVWWTQNLKILNFRKISSDGHEKLST